MSIIRPPGMSAMGQKQTFAPQKVMSALPPRKQTCAVQLGMSALGQKQTCAAQNSMSALTPKADICSAPAKVCFGPMPDINDMSAAAATAGERGVSLSACVLQCWRHSTGSDCRSLGCLPKYCLGGSTVRTSYTGNPNTRCLCRSELLRTKARCRPSPTPQ